MARTQEQRRQLTRQKLHEATIECIVTHGFSRLTTIEIARVAGVSQGALFRYYPTKTAAVVGATRYLFAKVTDDFRALLGSPEKANLVNLIDDLETWFASADFIAVSRLFAESSADAELRKAIAPIIEQHRKNTDALICRIFPEEGQAMQRSAAHAVIYLLQGIATERHLIRRDTIERNIMQLVRDFAGLMQVSHAGIITDKNPGGKKWNK